MRDLILQGDIDIFEALGFDLTDRIPGILRRDPPALNRPFGEYAVPPDRDEAWWPDPWCTPIAWAVIKNKAAAARVLLDHGAEQTMAPDGRSLHDLAGENGREAVAEVLRAQRG